MSAHTHTDEEKPGLGRQEVEKTAQEYLGFHDEDAGGDLDTRKREYTTMVNHYYDLVTDFYEFGWGHSFHFAPRRRKEKFKESLIRHENFLGEVLDLKSGMHILDVGCGVGGPLRQIASETGANIVGINNNAYQLAKAEKYVRKEGLGRQCTFLKSDFMNIPLQNASVDGIYAIEATCHAPDKTALFRELFRLLKPGAAFAGYEWCLTGKYEPDNADHRRIKKEIEEGDSLPDIATMPDVIDALENAGFEVVTSKDVAPEADPQTPWYRALTGKDLTLSSIPRTPIGRTLTNLTTRVLESVRIAPKGTSEVSSFLNRAADALVEGGETGIFTPMFFFHARKPEA
jgi:sterol 24-C-methyltransferase